MEFNNYSLYIFYVITVIAMVLSGLFGWFLAGKYLRNKSASQVNARLY